MNDDRAACDLESHDRLFDQAVLEYLEAKQSGSSSREVILARYPAVAAALSAFFAAEDDVGSALSPPSAPAPEAAPGAAAPSDLKAFGKYADLVFLSGGGMGAVYRCRDLVLGRPLALKVMHARLAPHPDYVRDFHEEARVASQLTHPNIAPVHELGTLPDGRPYFTMKLVEGRTLAEVIQEYHAKPTAERFDALLRHFVAVCNALAYAHQRKVLHRDLKPANVMVGAHDEVQVMDWGLSKVVVRDAASIAPASAANQPEPVWTGGPDSPTEPGLVRGTFAYMPPEQATPGTAVLDARCDVFALGALLCEILTKTPPYISAERDPKRRCLELWEAAQACATGPALGRLDASKAPAELKALTKQCLAREPKDRPANATAVAEGATKYLAGVQEKLRKAELARTRLRWQLGLAGAVLAAVFAGLAGWRWVAWQQEQRRAQAARNVMAAVAKAQVTRDRVRALPTQTPEDAGVVLAAWKEGMAGVESLAHSAYIDDVDAETRAAVDGLREEFAKGLTEGEDRVRKFQRDGRFIARLNRAAMLSWARSMDLKQDPAPAIEEYRAGFHEFGIDVVTLEPGVVAGRLAAEAPVVRARAVDGIDDWMVLDGSARPHLRQVVDRLDDGPWSTDFFNAFDRKDFDSLAVMADAPEVSARQAELLGSALAALGAIGDSCAVLKRAVLREPDDLGLRMTLGDSLAQASSADCREAAVCFQLAARISPSSSTAYSNLGVAQMQCAQYEDAELSLSRALELEPDSLLVLSNSGHLKLLLGDFDGADRLATRMLSIRPSCAEALALRASLRAAAGKYGEASDLLLQVPPPKRDELFPLTVEFNILLSGGGKEEEATATARKIVRLYPESPVGQMCSVLASLSSGDTKTAELQARAYLGRRPAGFFAALGHVLLGAALAFEGDEAGAEVELREANRSGGDGFVMSRLLLLNVLLNQGRFSEMEELADQLQKTAPDVFKSSSFSSIAGKVVIDLLKADGDQVDRFARRQEEPSDLNVLLMAEVALVKRRPVLSLRWYRRGLQATPPWMWSWDALCGKELGMTHQFNAARAAVLLAAGEGPEAAATSDAERRRVREDALTWIWAELKHKQDGSAGGPPSPVYRRFLSYCQTCPEFASVREPAALANLAQSERREWADLWAFLNVLSDKPDARIPHYALANIFNQRGEYDAAVAEFRKALGERPDDALTHCNFGDALLHKDLPEQAVAEFRKAIELNPDLAPAHLGLGKALVKRDRMVEALPCLERARTLDPSDPACDYHLGYCYTDQKRYAEAISAYRRYVSERPENAAGRTLLAFALLADGQTEEAKVCMKEARGLMDFFDSRLGALGQMEAVADILIKLKGDPFSDITNEVKTCHDYKVLRQLADECRRRSCFASAARIYAEAFAAQDAGNFDLELLPPPGEEDFPTPQYRALDCALLAAAGAGKDDPQLSDAARAKLRELARRQFESLVRAEALPSGLPPARNVNGEFDDRRSFDRNPLQHWKKDPKLAAVREPAALARLPAAERKEWQQFWTSVDAFLTRLDAETCLDRGVAYFDQDLPDDAVKEYRHALERMPDFAEAYGRLGEVLRRQSHFSESLAAYRRCHELGSKNPASDLHSSDWVWEAEELVRLNAFLPAILKGEAEPASPAGKLRFAWLCYCTHRYGAATRFYRESFAAQPDLAARLDAGDRYNGARAAALAGCGVGDDAAHGAAQERRDCRNCARDWLRADLGLWASKLEGGPGTRDSVFRTLRQWKEDPDLAGVRDKDNLAKLPAEEQGSWRLLWADVDALLTKLDAPAPEK